MEIKVKKLYDVSKIVVPEEMTAEMIKEYILDVLAEKSEFEFEQAKIDAWVEKQMEQEIAYGMTEMGAEEEVSDEMLEMMRQQGVNALFKGAVAKVICEEKGFVFTSDMYDDEQDGMTEEMPELKEMINEYKEMCVSGSYIEKAMELLDEQVCKKLEVKE